LQAQYADFQVNDPFAKVGLGFLASQMASKVASKMVDLSNLTKNDHGNSFLISV